MTTIAKIQARQDVELGMFRRFAHLTLWLIVRAAYLCLG
jgi:hypothetical protein